MIYYKTYRGETGRTEITYDEALRTLLGTYKDNDMTRDMLKVVNRIQCMFSTIEVEAIDDWGFTKTLEEGKFNELPGDAWYDDDGNRLPVIWP